MNASPSYAVLVLAGGASRRMGRDKRLLPGRAGEGLLSHVLETARALGRPLHLAVGAGQIHLPPLAGVSLHWDREPAGGPLAALVTAGEEIDEGLLVLAADLPDLRAADLREVVAAAASRPTCWVLLPRADGRDQPLSAYYRPEGRAALAAALAAGERSLLQALGGLPSAKVARLEVSRPQDYRSWNDPGDRRIPATPGPEEEA